MKNDENSSQQTQESLAGLWKEYQDHFESEEEFLRTVAVWPVCPECGRRREIVCPVCHRAGDIFPPADAEFWFTSDNPPSADRAVASCCGNGEGKCYKERLHSIDESPLSERKSFSGSSELIPHPGENSSEEPVSAEKDGLNGHDTVWRFSEAENDCEQGGHFSAASDSIYTAKTFSVSAPNFHRSTMETLDMTPEKKPSAEEISRKFHKEGLHLVICPPCDEPFVPKYLPVCKRCGRHFDDSADSAEQFSPSETNDIQLEAESGRVALVAVGMAILALLFILFLIFFVK